MFRKKFKKKTTQDKFEEEIKKVCQDCNWKGEKETNIEQEQISQGREEPNTQKVEKKDFIGEDKDFDRIQEFNLRNLDFLHRREKEGDQYRDSNGWMVAEPG